MSDTTKFRPYITEADITEAKAECIQVFRRTRSQVEAVKYVRDRLCCGLKDALDLFRAEHDPIEAAKRAADIRIRDAAPLMLEALQALDADWTEIIPHGPGEPGETRLFSQKTLQIWRDVRAAIAAATGGK